MSLIEPILWNILPVAVPTEGEDCSFTFSVEALFDFIFSKLCLFLFLGILKISFSMLASGVKAYLCC